MAMNPQQKEKEQQLIAVVLEINKAEINEWRARQQEREAACKWLVDNLTNRYNEEIGQFFRGNLEEWTGSKERGLVRIVKHGNIETLQVQPPEGGQYEIAVRVPLLPSETPEMGYAIDYGDKFKGYIASHGIMWGRNTGGH